MLSALLNKIFSSLSCFSDQPEHAGKKGKKRSKSSAVNQPDAAPSEPLSEVPSTSEDYNGL